MLARLVVVVMLTACSNRPDPKDACSRLAARLMPVPDPRSIERCATEYELDPGYARMVECLLAIDHPLFEKDLETCPGHERLPLFFNF